MKRFFLASTVRPGPYRRTTGRRAAELAGTANAELAGKANAETGGIANAVEARMAKTACGSYLGSLFVVLM